jgi:hypothetical protein
MLFSEISPCLLISAESSRVAKAPNKANDTNAADPMENPFPTAAVVFPAASKASVFFLTLAWRPAISAMPPALSHTGP